MDRGNGRVDGRKIKRSTGIVLRFVWKDVGKPRLLAMASGSHLGDGIPLMRS